MTEFPHSTGLPGLDRILEGLIPGDNVVFQVESVTEYRPFVQAFCAETLRRGRRLCYFRFARHEALLPEQPGIEIRTLQPDLGFEPFIAGVHEAIARHSPSGHFVFDCLSDLAADWYSDTMLGNFFTLTCPYLFDIEALAYFALFRNLHSFRATTPITDTAQVVIDVYRQGERCYLHPIRAERRHSPTLFMLHAQEGGELRPATHSAE
ncbi:MAG: pyruvate phosphate dikinase, partial [Planctomycetota bacterium]|nr:pyruvate phosphate dikinase [Planctomycetota bacterium]